MRPWKITKVVFKFMKVKIIKDKEHTMKSYISHLYDLDITENESNPSTKPSVKENNLYDELQQSLSKKQFQKFADWLEEYSERMEQECEIYFKKGLLLKNEKFLLIYHIQLPISKKYCLHNNSYCCIFIDRCA